MIWFALGAGAAALLVLMIVFVVSTISRKERRCYRCALPAAGQFMNLDYCVICRHVVMAMYPKVSHDPGFGFPGGPGHDPDGPDPYIARKKKEGGSGKED